MKAKLNKLVVMLAAMLLSSVLMAEIASSSDRCTVGDVEYLYTLRVEDDYTVTLVLESAIPLTGNYEVCVDIGYMLEMHVESWSRTISSLTSQLADPVDINALNRVVIGDSCFANDVLLDSISIRYNGDWLEQNRVGISAELGVELMVKKGYQIEIGKRAFYGASGLRFVAFIDEAGGESFKNSSLVKIGESAFEGCESLMVLGFNCDELVEIDDMAFCECHMFSGIVSDCAQFLNTDYVYGFRFCMWPDCVYTWDTPKLVRIGDWAFYGTGTEGYQDSYRMLEWTFGDKDLVVGEQAFARCHFLKAITFPNDMTRIPNNSFSGIKGDLGGHARDGTYENIATTLILPETLEEIGEGAFGSGRVRVVKWPAALKSIEKNAFCANLSKISYSANEDSTKVIEKLVVPLNIDLPQGLTNLGENAFSGWIYNYGSEPVWRDGKIVNFIGDSRQIMGECGMLEGSITIPTGITVVPPSCFKINPFLQKVVLHSGVTEIGSCAFQGCSRLKLSIPVSVRTIGEDVATDVSIRSDSVTITVPGVQRVVFEGLPPEGVMASGLLNRPEVLVPLQYKTEWTPYMNEHVKFAVKVNDEWIAFGGNVISTSMRADNPTVMDIKYRVNSVKDSVKIRVLAYEDGDRSFAKVLRPITFTTDANGNNTSANVGDHVTPNVEHTISWQVSSDWDVDLAKVAVEVLAMEDDLLPMQLVTLPATTSRNALTFSRNEQNSTKVMNALLWLYADKDAGLMLENGVLKNGDIVLANGVALTDDKAVSYVFSKMGYETLSGDRLQEVNRITRLGLNPGGIRQFAVKTLAK